jgi:magnesium chelatase subunit I
VVEREGISFMHPARFVLIGSANPEEGDLRPQLLDRFGLCARVSTITDLEARVEIVRRREQFERDPVAFCTGMQSAQVRMRRRIMRARQLVTKTAIDGLLLARVAELCLALNVDGHRGELAVLRASKAVAAFEGRVNVIGDDVRRVAPMALSHRVQQKMRGEVDPRVRICGTLDQILAGTSALPRTA